MRLLKYIFLTVIDGIILWFIECMRQVTKYWKMKGEMKDELWSKFVQLVFK